MLIKRPKTFAFGFSSPYSVSIQNYFPAQNAQMSLCFYTVCFNQKTSQVSPLRQNQEISDSNGCHGKDVWSAREMTGRILNSEETDGRRNASGE